MRKKFEDSLEYKMQQRLNQLSTNVVLWRDFADLAISRQLTRGFNKLFIKGLLIKMGRGVYAKAKISTFSGKPVPVDFADQLLRDSLDRLKVKWQPSLLETAYNRGVSTQVPVSTQVKLKSRLRRKIAINDYALTFEGNINAR